ncbi:unnamed protein product, partial [Ectocarpus sp. 12 AP-2014]
MHHETTRTICIERLPNTKPTCTDAKIQLLPLTRPERQLACVACDSRRKHESTFDKIWEEQQQRQELQVPMARLQYSKPQHTHTPSPIPIITCTLYVGQVTEVRPRG